MSQSTSTADNPADSPSAPGNSRSIPGALSADGQPLAAERANTALIVIDVQTGVMAASWHPAEVGHRPSRRHRCAQSDACVRSTIHGGFARGYNFTLVSDAHTTEDLSEWGAPPPEQVVSHTNLYWSFESGPGRVAQVLEAADVDFSAPGRNN